jgi:hypothetical protein
MVTEVERNSQKDTTTLNSEAGILDSKVGMFASSNACFAMSRDFPHFTRSQLERLTSL